MEPKASYYRRHSRTYIQCIERSFGVLQTPGAVSCLIIQLESGSRESSVTFHLSLRANLHNTGNDVRCSKDGREDHTPRSSTGFTIDWTHRHQEQQARCYDGLYELTTSSAVLYMATLIDTVPQSLADIKKLCDNP